MPEEAGSFSPSSPSSSPRWASCQRSLRGRSAARRLCAFMFGSPAWSLRCSFPCEEAGPKQARGASSQKLVKLPLQECASPALPGTQVLDSESKYDQFCVDYNPWISWPQLPRFLHKPRTPAALLAFRVPGDQCRL